MKRIYLDLCLLKFIAHEISPFFPKTFGNEVCTYVCMCECKIIQGMCVALFNQMVEKAKITVLSPAVESIKAVTVWCILYIALKPAAKQNVLLLQFTKSHKTHT